MPSKERHIVLEPKKKSFYFVFPYNELITYNIKKISGATWDKKGKIWKVSKIDSTIAKQILDFAEEFNFFYGDDELAYLQNLIEQGAIIYVKSLAGKSDFVAQGLKKKPYSYQQAGIERGIEEKRVLIGDEQGLGKTIQALGIVAHLQLYPCIIICPAVLKLNWKLEALQWIEGLTEDDIEILNGGTPNGYTPKKITIINYDILAHRWPDLNRGWASIIFDEIHYVKNPKSKRSVASRYLSKKSNYVIGLSGTPVVNRPVELVNILQILGRLPDMGGKSYFEIRYCNGHRNEYGQWDTTGASNLFELNSRLRSNGILIRRSKRSVLPYLPRKTRQFIPFELDNRNDYTRAEADLARWLADKAIEEEEFKLSLLGLNPHQRIKRIQSYHQSVEYKTRQTEQLRRFVALQQLASKGKLQGIRRWLDDFLDTDQKLVVFAKYVDTQRFLQDSLGDASSVHIFAEDTLDERQSAVERFQTNPNCRLFIGSLKAAGIGITLTAASHVAFVEVGWSPGEMDQAEDRLHRIGQEYPVNVYYLAAPDTMDEELINIIDQKRGVVTAATEGVDVSETGVMNALVGRLLGKYQKDNLIC